MRYPNLYLLLLLSSCSVATLQADKNPYQLPLQRGQVGYWRTEVKKGVKLDEFYRVARAWIRENRAFYNLKWERPIRNTTLLHSGIIPSSRLVNHSSDNYSNVRIQYYLTVIAKDDTCRIAATTFQVEGLHKNTLFLEQVADDKILCQSVNQEMEGLVESFGDYIRKNTEKQ